MDIVLPVVAVALLAAMLLLLVRLIHKTHDGICGPTFREPEQAAPYIIKHFDQLTEMDFQKLERALARHRDKPLEAGNVYALRISLVIRRVTNLKTLAGRWNTSHCGAGNCGLLMGMGSRNYKQVHTFLSGRYLQRFRQIAETMLTEAETKEMETGRRGALSRARTKIHEAMFNFTYPLDGLYEAANQLSQPSEEHEN